jgi:hypothetical protein
VRRRTPPARGYQLIASTSSRNDRFKANAPPRPGPRSLARSRPKQKRPSGRSPQKACFTMNAGPLGRLTPPGAIKRAARRGGWPRRRGTRRIEEICGQPNLAAQCTDRRQICQSKITARSRR